MISKEELEKYTVREVVSVHEALNKLNESAVKTMFIIDSANRVIGSLTDGDIRRSILAGFSIDDNITSVMNRNFRSLPFGEFNNEKVQEFKAQQITIIPLVDKKGILRQILDLSVLYSIIPMDAVIMAGGIGKRLRPLTLEVPKPLLKIGEKPILEHNIDRLRKFGVRQVHLSVNYLADKIKDYFQNGESKGLSIKYVEEDMPMGTAGALTLIDNFHHDYILMMNSDLLTDVNFANMFEELIKSKADMIVATTPYEVVIPYGVIETNGELIQSLKEKPTYTYYSNAGIYIFKKEVIGEIPKNTHYNATDLMERLIAKNKKVIHYPIRTYWLDIGKLHDFEKAQKDIQYLNL